jgi:hypothetical protein
MIRKQDAGLAAVCIAAGMLAAACSTTVSYVSASDPVIGICQQPAMLNISNDKLAIDNANNTDTGAPGAYGSGQAMVKSQITSVLRDGKAFAADVSSLQNQHPGLASDFRAESALFEAAGNSPGGLTTNTVAVSVDKYTGLITGACNSFEVGTATQETVKPGPGFWSWSLFGIVLGGYVFMIIVSSFLIAISERRIRRGLRRSSVKLFWLSVIWPVMIWVAIFNAWWQMLDQMKLTPGEKKDDRFNALTRENARLEALNDELRKKQS